MKIIKKKNFYDHRDFSAELDRKIDMFNNIA